MPTDASRLREALKQIEIVAEHQPAARQSELDTARECIEDVLAGMEGEELVADGGLAISPEEFESRLYARSETPAEQRPSCPHCGSIDLTFNSNKQGTAEHVGWCNRCNRPLGERPEGGESG